MEALDEQLKDLPPMLRIHMDIIQLLCAIEKECATSANYAKGSGSELWYFLSFFIPLELKIARHTDMLVCLQKRLPQQFSWNYVTRVSKLVIIFQVSMESIVQK